MVVWQKSIWGILDNELSHLKNFNLYICFPLEHAPEPRVFHIFIFVDLVGKFLYVIDQSEKTNVDNLKKYIFN